MIFGRLFFKSFSVSILHDIKNIKIENIKNSELELVVTNSIPLKDDAKECGKIHALPLGPLLAESIRRISNKESISAMFL